MSAPRIRLSRIIALNWYGFRTIIDVNGLTLLCGETGTGKSVLLDLIQFVLCPDSAKFNKAAAGDKHSSGGGKARDLRGYCLCDTNTKDRDSGQPRYLRRSGASIAALEFEWPAQSGETEPRRETWGLRIEFESTSAQPSYVRFFAPQRLETQDFCDATGDLLGEDAFKMRIKRDLSGDAGFTTHKAYMEEMGVPRHLQFDHAQMRKTLPKAIAFELDSNYQRFIREFILERNDLDIASTKSSLDALRETEKRVETLNEQFLILTAVCDAHDKYAEAARELAIGGHLRHALEQAQAAEKLAQCEAAIARLKEKNKEDLAAMERATGDKESAQQRLNAIRFVGGQADVNLQKLSDAQVAAARLQGEHDELKRMAKTAREFLAQRSKAWADWRRHAASLNWEITVEMESVDQLAHHETIKALDAVIETRGVFGSIWNDTEAKLRPINDRIIKLEAECGSLEGQLKRLDRRSTAATPLLDALRSTGTRAETVGRVIEVSTAGEPWWGVIEALLGEEKNAVLLADQKDFAKALDVWRRTANAEPLIRPADLVALKAQEKSLAGLIETENEDARRFVDRRLGRFAAVKTAKELELYDSGAVTPDGLLNEPPVRRRITPEKEFTLGEKGIQRLRAMKEAALAECAEELKQLRQRRDDVMTWLRHGKEQRLDQDDSPKGHTALVDLPGIAKALTSANETLKLLADPELESRLCQMKALESEVSRLDQAIGRLSDPITGFNVQLSKLTDEAEDAREEHDSLRIAVQESRAKLPLDVREPELQQRLEAALNTPSSWSNRHKQAEIAQESWRKDAERWRAKRHEERVRLQQPKHEAEYAEFDPQDESNNRYANRRDELQLHQLPRYHALAADHRVQWEKRLQDDILDKLWERLEESTRTVSDFRRTLSHDIGNYRYVLTQRRDPAHHAIWELLKASKGTDGLQPGDDLLDYKLKNEIEEAKRELRDAIDKPEDPKASALLDYRNYHRYNLEMIPSGHDEESEGAISLQERGAALSGGEGQAPFFVAMLAAFHRVYDLGLRGQQASLGLVVMDEAFSKLSAGHISDCLRLAQNFGLQLVLAFPMDRLGTMINHADSIIQCRLEKRHDVRGAPTEIINDVIYWERQRMIDEILS